VAYRRSGIKRVIYFLNFFECGMLQPEEKHEYPIYFYKHQPREVLILDEVVDVIVKGKKIARWTITVEEQLMKLNLGNEGDPRDSH
jgi:hypothetical protein